MLYNMLYNPFWTRARVADPPAYPLCPWCACLCSAGFIRHQTRQWLCLPHQKPPFLPAQPPIPPPSTPSSSEPPRRRPGAAALSRSGAAAWRAAQVVVLVELLQGLVQVQFKPVPGARRLEVGNRNHQCL